MKASHFSTASGNASASRSTIRKPILRGQSFFDGDELQRKLRVAIASLPEKQRLVFNMKYFDDMKYEDMSNILGTSIGALKASYHLAVKKIENFFTGTD